MLGSGWPGNGLTTSESISSGNQLSAVVVGLARPHPVTGRVRVTHRAVGAFAHVIPRRQESASRADRQVRLPLRTGRRVGVQLQRRTKGETAVGRANVEDVARIAAIAVLGIDQVNDIVERSRLTPALVPPEGPMTSGKHAGEEAGRDTPGPAKGGPSISVAPRGTAIG